MFYLQFLFFCVTLSYNLDYFKHCSGDLTVNIIWWEPVVFNDLLIQQILCMREKKFAWYVHNLSHVFHLQVLYGLIKLLWYFYVCSQRTEHLVVYSHVKHLKQIVLFFLLSEPCIWWYVDEAYSLTVGIVKHKINPFDAKDSFFFVVNRKWIVIFLRSIYHCVCLYFSIFRFDQSKHNLLNSTRFFDLQIHAIDVL